MNSLTIILFVVSLSGSTVRAETTRTCDFECESNPRFSKLSCEDLRLQCVPDPCCHTETRYLSMANNQLTHLKVLAFRSFPRLRILDIRQNAIDNIAPGAFTNLAQLQMIDLRANRLRHLYAGMFNGMRDLQKLYLANNLIETIAPGTFAGMTNLISLKLNNNQLPGLPTNMFLPLQSLQRLYLYGNQITEFNEHAFRGLTNLVTLSLAENPLVTFPNILPYLPEISHIRLQSTPLVCDCRLEFLRRWLRENLYDAYESYAMCSQPQSLLGTPIYRIPDPLVCDSVNHPVSREIVPQSVNFPNLPPSTAHSDSEVDYSAASASYLDATQRGRVSASVAHASGRGTGLGAGRNNGRTINSNQQATSAKGRLYFDSKIPETPMIDMGGPTTPVVKDSPEDGTFPMFTGTNMSNFDGSFTGLPPPRRGSKSEPSFQDGHQDDSIPTTASFAATDARTGDSKGEAGPPKAWGLKGSSVVIRCPVHIHNWNETTIKWLTPHGKLIMSNVSRYGITRRGSLVIHNLQAYDHGTYRCVVRRAMNSVKMLPTRLILACPCLDTQGQSPFQPNENTTGRPNYHAPGRHPYDIPLPPHSQGCSSVPMVVAIVTTFQATVALCVITFCLCCSKNINSSFKDRACTGEPEPISVVGSSEKFDAKTRDFAFSGETSSASPMTSRGSESYEVLSDRFMPRQASSVRSSDSFYESYPRSEYVNYRKPKNYMYMVGYIDNGSGRRAIGYRSSSDSQCPSIKEMTNENIYVTKD